ncbi:MAG TPA: HNH endonuclease [Enhygromyxa sp.]|nr:HNH endonuclease [Enhygromyxa sp.]
MSDATTIAFAAQLLELVHHAETTASYKYALLTALIELAVERHGAGVEVDTLTTRELASRVLELYWPQARRFHGRERLRQIGARGRSLVDRIAEFRESLDAADSSSPQLAARRSPAEYRRLLDEVEWIVIRNPLPRLQRIGNRELELLYEPDWQLDPPQAPVRRYQRQRDANREFDNRVRLLPGVAAKLAVLAPLFLPLIRHEWTEFVARRNKQLSPEARLEEFLFVPGREQLRALRPDLARLQAQRCFYCGAALRGTSDVDHFLAWSRCGASAIENLVVAHPGCNNDKSDHLVAARHLDAWIDRLDSRGDDLQGIAEARHWYAEPSRIGALVRGSYLDLAARTPLWAERGRWVNAGDEPLKRSTRALARVLRRSAARVTMSG